MRRAYGRKPGQNPKFRIERYQPSEAKLPDEWSYEYDMPAAMDQGQYGTCVSFATAASQMFYRKKRGHGTDLISRSAIYSQAKYSYESNDIQDDGLQVTDGLLVPLHYGFCLETQWPYPDDPSGVETGDLLQPVPSDLWDKTFDETGYLTIDPNTDEDSMRALIDHGVQVVGSNFPSAWENIGQDGFCDPKAATDNAGGHCYVRIGYSKTKFGGAWKYRNSWGPDYGDGGDFWVPFSAREICPSFIPDEIYCVRYTEPTIRAAQAA